VSISGHWYTKAGDPMHTQPTKSVGAKNPTRATTITDAKKLNLLPSVSGITRMLAAPALDRYKQNRIIEECFNRPPVGAETVKEYAGYIIEKADSPMKEAADFGTTIHKAIECALAGSMPPDDLVAIFPSTGKPVAVKAIVSPVLALLESKGVKIGLSESVLTHTMGYAGTTDLVGDLGAKVFIGDFKTKKTKPGVPIEAPETYAMQLAAYRMAFADQHGGTATFDGPAANIFISSTEEGRIEWHEYSPDELNEAWVAFRHCLGLWKWVNGYDASFAR